MLLKCVFQLFGSGNFSFLSKAFTQTQGISGMTSQLPFSRTPPHGPLRSVFGQVIGHVIPVSCKTHWPHIRQSQIGFFIPCSTNSTIFNAFKRIPSPCVVLLLILLPDELPLMHLGRIHRRQPRPHTLG